MAVPPHVRNDFAGSHFSFIGINSINPLNWYANLFEHYVKKHPAAINLSPKSPSFTNPKLTYFWDANKYITGNSPYEGIDQGLAEYTNANFVSDSTLFNNYSFPSRQTSVQKVDYQIVDPFDSTATVARTYYKKIADGETNNGAGYRLAGVDYLWHYRQFLSEPERANTEVAVLPPMDNYVHADYAQLLLPRAVGYSTALLDYFFRGSIDLQPLAGGVTFRTITLTAQNTTANEEEMPAGEVSLVIRYKELQESGSGAMRTLNFPADEYKYRVVTLPGLIKIPNKNDQSPTVQLTFDLSTDPLPLHIADVTLQLVYKGTLGNEDGAVAVGSVVLEALGTDLGISLPSDGVFAKTAGSNFTSIELVALTNIPGGLSLPDGVIELVLEYQVATTDPFASLPVDSEPQNADSYIIRLQEKNGVNTLPQGVPVELQFDLSVAPLPLWATDVYLNLIYRRTGDPESKSIAVGYRDISEPTPVDIFNNTDYVCISNQWYHAGTPEARAAADLAGNQNSIDDDTDTYPHDFTNIYVKASAADNPVRASASIYDFFAPGPLSPNSVKRMGHVLTDYALNYSFLPNWVHTDPMDEWTRTEVATLNAGTAVKNQTDPDGVYRYPGMYNMRGKPMWWGAGIIYNIKYPGSSSCSWEALPLP